MIRKIVKFLVALFIIAAIGIIGVIAVREWDSHRPRTRSEWVYKFPQSKVELPVCNIILPEGWSNHINSEYDPNKAARLISLHTEIFGYRKQFPITEKPYINLFSGKKTEKTFLRSTLGNFLTDNNSIRTIIVIDGRELILYRYEGNKMIGTYEPNIKKVIETEMPSITIGIWSESGFYGVFWGLKENEQSFMEMIKSVKWK